MCAQAVAAGVAQRAPTDQRAWLWMAGLATLLLSAAVSGLALASMTWFTPRLGLDQHGEAIVACLLLLPISALFWTLSAALGAMDRPVTYAALQCLAAAMTVVALLVALPSLGLDGAMVAPFIANAIACAVLVAVLVKVRGLPNRGERGLATNLSAMRTLVGAGFVLLVGGAAPQVAQLLLRSHLIDAGAIEQAGLWQATWKVSEAYLLPFTILIQVYFLSRLASAWKASSYPPRLLSAGVASAILSLVVVALALWGVGDLVVRTLLDARFAAAAQLLPLQALADGLRLGVVLIGTWLISGSRWRWYIALEIGYWGLFAISGTVAIMTFEPTASALVLAYLLCALVVLGGLVTVYLGNWLIRRSRGRTAS